MSGFDNSFETQQEITTDQTPESGNSEDVYAAIAIISIAILGTIHYIYTGGLLAFIHDMF